MKKNIYFIRHGLSELNKKGVFSGITDTPLAKEGKDQAKKAGAQAKNLGIDLILCSPLTRTKQTAEIIAHEINYPVKNIIYSSLLIERNFGVLEGAPYDPDIDMDGISDLETDDELVERAQLAVAWIDSHDYKNVLIVSHGAIGRAMRAVIHNEYPIKHQNKFKNAEVILFRGVF